MKAPQINDLTIATIAAKAFIALPPGPSAGAQAAPSGIGSALDSVRRVQKVHHDDQTGNDRVFDGQMLKVHNSNS